MKQYIFNHKKKLIASVLLITILFVLMCLADNKQQQRIFKCQEGYRLMQESNYKEALESFHTYYDGRTDFYWKLSQMMQDESYHRQSVENAMKTCEEYLEHHYQVD